MKKSEIKVGGLYRAKVSGRIVTVRVDAIREDWRPDGRPLPTKYDVTNLATGRKTIFRSAVKFRYVAPTEKDVKAAKIVEDADQFAREVGMTPGEIMRAERAESL